MGRKRVWLAVLLLAGLGVAGAQMPGPPQMPSIPQGPPMPGDMGNPNTQSNGQSQQSQGQPQSSNSRFVGGWCAQGDPTKQTSISFNGGFYNLTNETGDTSIGNLQGNNQIQAPGWQFVTGTLGRNGQIQWSNGTFWARCPVPNGG